MSALIAKLTLEYDGTPFAGWAAQPGLRTVASELERALTTVLRRPVDLTVAGRTDGGRITSYHVYFDQLAFLGQLGLLPEPAAAG